MKKPSERRADASAWLPLRVTSAFAIHLARKGRLAWASTQLLMHVIEAIDLWILTSALAFG